MTRPVSGDTARTLLFVPGNRPDRFPKAAGTRCSATRPGSAGEKVASYEDYLRIFGLPSGGAIRVSVGLASNLADVERFLAFAEDTYRDRLPSYESLKIRERC
jgi:hypothetical protein